MWKYMYLFHSSWPPNLKHTCKDMVSKQSVLSPRSFTHPTTPLLLPSPAHTTHPHPHTHTTHTPTHTHTQQTRMTMRWTRRMRRMRSQQWSTSGRAGTPTIWDGCTSLMGEWCTQHAWFCLPISDQLLWGVLYSKMNANIWTRECQVSVF